MRKPFALVMAIVLLLSLAACNGGGSSVTQEEYDWIVSERDTLRAEIEVLRNELSALRGEFEGLRGGVTSVVGELDIGELIVFGDILWRVLDVQEGRALILSENILSTRAYHMPAASITWEDSLIRRYLNGEFYLTAFSAEERGRIAETTVRNDQNPRHGTSGGNDTVDKVFLLSIEEAGLYFNDNSSRIALNADGAASWWWMRSPGVGNAFAAYVNRGGSVSVLGEGVSVGSGGVRPALWLNLEP